MNDWKVKIEYPVNRLGIDIYIFRKLPEGRVEVLQSGERNVVADLGAAFGPSLSLTGEMFQALVDAVHKDFKPSEGKFTEGKLEATLNHLADMRTLLKLK